MKKYLMGIDNGSQSTKVTIFDMEGNEICYGSQNLKPIATPEPGVAFHPDDDLWYSIVGGIRNCIKNFNGDVNDIAAVGLCTIRCCRAMLKEDCSLQFPALSWMDQRLSGPYVHENDEVKYVTTTSGYLAYKLTGEKKDTFSNCECYWPIDINAFDWSKDDKVFEECGLKRNMVFDLINPGEIYGKIKSDVAKLVGLPEGIPIVATGNDKAVEVLGSGVDTGKTIMISLGTFISAMMYKENYYENAQNFFPTIACRPFSYVYECNGIRRGMWTVSWYKEILGNDLVLKAKEKGISEEEYLNINAEKLNPGSDGLITLLDWLASPSIPYRKGVMIGFDQRHTRFHIYRSILEAIAFNIKNNIELMLDEINENISEIVIIGGGSKSNLLTKIFADMFGHPVKRRVASSSACLGAAICAAMAIKEYDSFDEAVEKMVKTKDITKPDMNNNELYNRINEEVVKKCRVYTDEILNYLIQSLNKEVIIMKNLKKYFQFALVVLAAGSIYPLVYLKTNYQETILSVFGITLSQLNFIYAALGIVFIVGYFPSGWIADKFSTRYLLTFSLAVTGLGGLWFAQVPKYSSVIIIFVIWGVSTVLTFWSAHMKAVKLLSSKEDEGRFFGILDGGRGIVEAVLASFALMIFSSVVGKSTDVVIQKTALVRVIYMYSIVLLILAVLIYIFVKPNEEVEKKLENQVKNQNINKFSTKESLKIIMSNRLIWTLGLVIFMGYTVFWTNYYMGGYLQTNVGFSAVNVGRITLIMLWMRPIGGTCAGFLGDKFGKMNVLQIALLFGGLALLFLAIVPATSSTIVFYILIIFFSLMIYAIRGLYWSLLGECKISDKVVGMAIGFVSLIAYLPDIILPTLNTNLFNVYGDKGGYNAYFMISGIAGILGVVLLGVFKKFVKAQNNNSKTEEFAS